MYLWQLKGWPKLVWEAAALAPLLARAAKEQGRLLGKMESLGFDLRGEAHLRAMTQEVLKSSEIEGEKLNGDQVRSSIARKLGMDVAGLVRSDRNVDGVVEMMLDATGNYTKPLTDTRLFAWHKALFPTARSAMRDILVGKWRDDRDGPMQVVSGPIGRQKVHYQAPPAKRVGAEIKKFLAWFNKPGDMDPLLVASLAHLWFVTIHPFDDGNGRVARAVADMALARSEGSSQRFYSMSAQIRHERNDYYRMLERTQKGELDVTAWHEWFLGCLLRAMEGSQGMLGGVLDKARFWERFAKEPMHDRQIKVLNRLLDGFEGKLTTSKWAALTKCSQDTAYRDILDLVAKGALKKDLGGGRSTSYSLNLN
ncbi:Fic family protein [Steroidobacter sp.]|uniref:Fic family protein n=1 Tax=Steroidobacter sp. TaxID=1978227 RepID=UPI001A63130F|nr:Fic family protein [Steroidobacter sp.]MBL8265427.1 Fic family protein [Steroidobacter sp.]